VGMLKPSRLAPCALALVVGEIRTRALFSLGLGDAVGEAALKHSAALQRARGGAVMKKPVGFLPAPGDSADVDRIRKIPLPPFQSAG